MTLSGTKLADHIMFGGSFDPPHVGHFSMARYIIETGIADSLDFIPVAVSPFKLNDPPPANPRNRLDMLRLGVEELCSIKGVREHIRIREIELDRPPPSYTVDTCRILRNEMPGKKIAILMGSDSFVHFKSWHMQDEIIAHHPIVVFMRSGFDGTNVQGHRDYILQEYGTVNAQIHILDNPRVDCSSSEIKELLSTRRSISLPGFIRDCLPASIAAYVEEHQLYIKK
jgi:nicotinate-nucleotide adenylyltransferase